MPTTKHKRKATAHTHSKPVKPQGLISTHPKAFVLIGLFCLVVSVLLLAFQAQDNAMFGIAMISLVTGVVLTFSAKVALDKKKKT